MNIQSYLTRLRNQKILNTIESYELFSSFTHIPIEQQAAALALLIPEQVSSQVLLWRTKSFD